MSNLEEPKTQPKDTLSLTHPDATAEAEIEQANHLYSQVLKMSEDWESVDEVKAKLIVVYANDAVELYGRTNHEKKVELNRIIEQAEQIVPPDSIENLMKRAERFVLEIVFPRNRKLRNALLITIGSLIVISIIGTSLITITSLFPDNETAPTPLTGIHFSFNPPSPIQLTNNDVEVKATVLDKDGKVVDLPVTWSVKHEADYSFISVSQEGNSVKVTRKPEANVKVSDDLPLIVELIVKTKPTNGSDEVFTDGINVILGNPNSKAFNESWSVIPQPLYASYDQKSADYLSFVSFSSNTQNKGKPKRIAAKPIVYLMDTRVSRNVVYSQGTWDLGATNAHDIREILRDLPIDSRVETVNPKWRGEQTILDANPALILIHYSCFYGHSNPHDDEKRFQEFLRYIVQTNRQVQFLVYSRSKNIIEKEPYGQHRYLFPLNYERRLEIPGLRNRIHPFYIQSIPGSFTDTGTSLSLKAEVKRILKLP